MKKALAKHRKSEVVREVRKLGQRLEKLSNSKERCGEEGSLQDGEGLAAGSAVQQAAGYS